MRFKVTNTIPGKKAKDRVSENKIQNPSETIETAGENAPKAEKPENREPLDEKNRKFEARKAFDAAVRGKLKYSGKR